MSSTTRQEADARKPQGTAESSPWMNLWREKQAAGMVGYDPRLLVLHRAEKICGEYGWGTVFYSKAREDYKTRVGSLPERSSATFDLELMDRLKLARAGGLNIAANPNSIVAGHLVIWPGDRRADLTFEDLRDMSRLAREQQAWTFIHNMDQSAASIVDWAHFQAYPWEFPMVHEMGETIYEATNSKTGRGLGSWDGRVLRLNEDYPAYVLKVECERAEQLALWLSEMLGALALGREVDRGRRIPFNIVWRGASAWLIPRSLSQSLLAATYVGALEMGGLFCLPNADNLRQYLPDALRSEVRQASIADEPEMREWCEQRVREIGIRLSSSDRSS